MRTIAIALVATLLGLTLADVARQCDQQQTHFWKNVTLKSKESGEYDFRRTSVATVPGPLYISAWMNSFNAKKDVDEDTGSVVRGTAVITARLTALAGIGPARGTPPSLHVGTFRRRTDFTPYDSETGTGNLTVGKFGMAFAVVFTEIVEFVDTNGDRKFDANDTVLQTINLDQLYWDKLCWESPNANTPGIISFNISATDSRLTFSEKVEFSNVVGKLHNNKILTPKAGKISLEIRDFKYSPGVTESQLAIHVYVLAAAGATKSVIKKALGTTAKANSALTMSDAAYFTWDTEVNVTAGKISALHHNDFVDGDVADLTGETANIMFSAYAGGNLTTKHSWFSIDANQPSHVYWDPELGAGEIPAESDGLPTWALILIAGGAAIVCATLIGVAIATWRRRRSNYVDL